MISDNSCFEDDACPSMTDGPVWKPGETSCTKCSEHMGSGTQFGIYLQPRLSLLSTPIQKYITKSCGYLFKIKNARVAHKSITKFARQHDIAWETFKAPGRSGSCLRSESSCATAKNCVDETCAYHFDSLDAFFSRHLTDKVQTDIKKSIESYGNGEIVSPATCRSMFGLYSDLKLYWIWGKNSTIEDICAKLITYSPKQTFMLISRLAPRDYHRIHSPVCGFIKSITNIGGEYFSVHPNVVQSKVSIFQKNRRIVIIISTEKWGPVTVILVGATCVGSIELSVEVGEKLELFSEIGSYHFGGSTILTVFKPDNSFHVHEFLKRANKAKAEMYTRVGQLLMTQDANIGADQIDSR